MFERNKSFPIALVASGCVLTFSANSALTREQITSIKAKGERTQEIEFEYTSESGGTLRAKSVDDYLECMLDATITDIVVGGPPPAQFDVLTIFYEGTISYYYPKTGESEIIYEESYARGVDHYDGSDEIDSIYDAPCIDEVNITIELRE